MDAYTAIGLVLLSGTTLAIVLMLRARHHH